MTIIFDKEAALRCDKTKIINKLNEVINIEKNINIIRIDCAYHLLKWSAAPVICKERHNVLISSLDASKVIQKTSFISIICSSVSESELIKKLTVLSIRRLQPPTKVGNILLLREEEVNFYLELVNLKGCLGKYRSNKKKRLMAKLGLKNDYEMTIYFNMVFSLPYAMLRIIFLKTKNLADENNALTLANDKLTYRTVEIQTNKESFLVCKYGNS